MAKGRKSQSFFFCHGNNLRLNSIYFLWHFFLLSLMGSNCFPLYFCLSDARDLCIQETEARWDRCIPTTPGEDLNGQKLTQGKDFIPALHYHYGNKEEKVRSLICMICFHFCLIIIGCSGVSVAGWKEIQKANSSWTLGKHTRHRLMQLDNHWYIPKCFFFLMVSDLVSNSCRLLYSMHSRAQKWECMEPINVPQCK